MKKTDCSGCYNEIYNYKSQQQCFSFDPSKKLVKKYVVHKDQRPPFYKTSIRKVPPCYQPQHYVVVDLDKINSKGYWRF